MLQGASGRVTFAGVSRLSFAPGFDLVFGGFVFFIVRALCLALVSVASRLRWYRFFVFSFAFGKPRAACAL